MLGHSNGMHRAASHGFNAFFFNQFIHGLAQNHGGGSRGIQAKYCWGHAATGGASDAMIEYNKLFL